MYPYLREKVVLVDGPGATGIYDLNAGKFLRVSKEAGSFLRRLDGTIPLSSLDDDEKEFVAEAVDAGILGTSDTLGERPRTPLSDVTRRYRPVKFAWIELTSKCNQLCLHCFVGDQLNKTSHVDKSKIFDYVEVLNRHGARHIVLSGGEPTMHPDFEAIVDHIGRYRFRISVLSNGSAPRIVKLADCFVRNDVSVKIPLLGWGASHDRMSGVLGVFERTIKAIVQLKEMGVDIQLGTTVTALNHLDIPKIREFANGLGLSLEVSPIYAVGWAKKNGDSLLSLPMSDILAVCRADGAAQRASAEPLVKIRRRKDAYPANPVDYEAVDLHDFLTEHHECGQKIVAILANGTVTPCLMLRDDTHALGSLERNTLDEILNGNTVERPRFDELMSLASVPGCNECEARYVCKAGGCSASAHALTGSVQRKNPLYDRCYYVNEDTRREMGMGG